MIRVRENKNNTIHGTYKSKDVTLKVLIKNDVAHAENIQTRLETFRETDVGVVNLSLEGCVLKLDKDVDTCTVSLTKTLSVSKEHMIQLEGLLLQMCSTATENPVKMVTASSSTDLLHKS
jgi:hypothetical protein